MAKILDRHPVTVPIIAESVYGAAIIREADERRATPTRLRMSSIGKCERLLWAQLHGIENERPFSGRMLVLFDHGRVIETHLVRLMKLAGHHILDVDPSTKKQYRHSALDDRLVGHSDGRVLNVEATELLEIKSANTDQFAQCVELGYETWRPEYADQLQVYMGSAGIEDALAVVYCKDTSHIYAERVKFDPLRYADLLAKAERVLDAKTPIDRPAEGKSQYCGYCKWCPVNLWCWDAATDVAFDT